MNLCLLFAPCVSLCDAFVSLKKISPSSIIHSTIRLGLRSIKHVLHGPHIFYKCLHKITLGIKVPVWHDSVSCCDSIAWTTLLPSTTSTTVMCFIGMCFSYYSCGHRFTHHGHELFFFFHNSTIIKNEWGCTCIFERACIFLTLWVLERIQNKSKLVHSVLVFKRHIRWWWWFHPEKRTIQRNHWPQITMTFKCVLDPKSIFCYR